MENHSKPDKQHKAEDLHEGLFKIVFGIMDSWKLKQGELAAILQRSESTISYWKREKSIGTTAKPSADDQLLFEFIEFYDALTSLLPRTSDQIKWLRTPSAAFQGASPVEFMKQSAKHLYSARDGVDRLARP